MDDIRVVALKHAATASTALRHRTAPNVKHASFSQFFCSLNIRKVRRKLIRRGYNDHTWCMSLLLNLYIHSIMKQVITVTRD